MFAPIKTALLVGVLLTPVASAFSFFDDAPPIGLPTAIPLTFTASVSVGFDSNVDSTSDLAEGSLYSSFSLSANYAHQSANTSYSYTARVGGTLYGEKANNVDQELFGDIYFTGSITHSLTGSDTISASLSLSMSPSPDYSNGISAAKRQGDAVTWNSSMSYNRAFDSRYSGSLSASYSGTIYLDNTFEYDNREYIGLSAQGNYKASSLTSYNVSMSGQLDIRQFGWDSENVYLNGGFTTSLSPESSMSASIGLQYKLIDSGGSIYPTLSVSYRRTVNEGLSISAYITTSNENTESYLPLQNGGFANYGSNQTWRLGVTASTTINPWMSVNWGASAMVTNVTDGEFASLDELFQSTLNLTAGTSFSIAAQTSLSLNYMYTIANDDAGGYNRHSISATLSYTF